MRLSVAFLLVCTTFLAAHAQDEDAYFNHNRITRVPSSQPGSEAYFGVGVCAVDIDRNNRLDLAVGAWYETYPYDENGEIRAIIKGGILRFFSIPDLDEITRTTNPDRPENYDYFGYALAWGDINSDGQNDLVVGEPGRKVGSGGFVGRVLVYTGNSFENVFGILHPSPSRSDLFGYSVAIADIDATPGNEIIVGVPFHNRTDAGAEGQVVVYKGDDGSPLLYIEPDTPVANGHFGSALACGDFDGDGVIDLAVGSDGANDSIGTVYLFKGPGYTSASLVPPTDPVPLLGYGRSLAAGDLDGDGIQDLAVGRPGATPTGGGGSVGLLFGPNFARRQRINPPDDDSLGFGNSVEIADLDRDDRMDLIVGAMATTSPNLVTKAGEIVIYSTALHLEGIHALPGDVDGDEDHDPNDLFHFGDLWGQTGENGADQNGDGIVDADDADDLVVAIGASDSDLTGDGNVNYHDLFLFSEAWQRPRGEVPGTDMDRNGLVEAADLRLFLQFSPR